MEKVSSLCDQITMMENQSSLSELVLPIPIPNLQCEEVNLDLLGRLVFYCKQTEVKFSDNADVKVPLCECARIHDVLVLVFVAEVVLFKVFEYRNVLDGRSRTKSSFLALISTQQLKARILPDQRGARHMVKLSEEKLNGKEFYLSSTCKESQLDFYNALQRANDGSMSADISQTVVPKQVTIHCNMPPPRESRHLRWWMT